VGCRISKPLQVVRDVNTSSNRGKYRYPRLKRHLNFNKNLFHSHNPILIIKQRGIGDVILSLPTLRTIRKYFSHAPISLVLDSPSVSLLKGDPDIDEIIEVKKGYLGISHVVKKITGRFGIVFDLISTPFSLFLSVISGAPVRVGWSKPQRKRGRVYTHPIDISVSIPANLANLRAVTCLGMEPVTEKPRLSISEGEIVRIKKVSFSKLNLDSNKLTIAIQPGSLFETKQWFPKRFALLANRLVKHGIQVVITGSEQEKEVVNTIKLLSNNNLTYLSPMPIHDYARFLASVDLFVTNDGGPLHIAQSVGTKTLAIFGSTDPAIWFPYRVPDEGSFVYSNRECSPCGKRRCRKLNCLKDIQTEDVFTAIKKVLGERV
jgi:ADP-heptose:LPS heptosyltransferase